MSNLTKAEKLNGMTYAMVRTEKAGVFCGYVKKRSGREGIVIDAIRIHHWSGAASLSQLAMEGTNDPEGCRFAMVVMEVQLTGIIEVIPMTEKALKNIQNVKSWKMM